MRDGYQLACVVDRARMFSIIARLGAHAYDLIYKKSIKIEDIQIPLNQSR